MGTKPGPPAIYWVVGNGTDVGKTTVASALIKVLNASGERAIGFKPYAASLLQDLVDFMIEKYPDSRSKLFGNDAWELTTASPLTGTDLVDLVVPTQLLCYPTWQSTVLMRTGSASLDNVEYFRSEDGDTLKDRPDLQYIIGKSGLPFDNSILRDGIGLGDAAGVSPDKPKQAFDCLLEIGVDAVVCEGAGGWLPVWQDCPAVNHVIFVADGMVIFFPGLNLCFPFDPTEPLQGVETLTDILKNPELLRYTTPLYLVESERRDALAQQIAQALVARVQQQH